MNMKAIIGWILGHPCEHCCAGVGHSGYKDRFKNYFYKYLHIPAWHKPSRLLCRLLWEDDNFWCKLWGHDINAIEIEMKYKLMEEELEKNKGKDYQGNVGSFGISNLSDDMGVFSPAHANIPFRCKRCKKTI